MRLLPAWTAIQVIRLGLLGGLLVMHFLAGFHSHLMLGPSRHRDYSQTYEFSLSFVGGHGLRQLAPPRGEHAAPAAYIQMSLPDTAAAAPLREFLLGRRERLRRDELEAYWRTVSAPEATRRRSVANHFASSRVLDLYVAGLLWKWFGIGWSNVYLFYSLMNAGSCLLVFLTARRLAGSCWAGLFAAALYAASPLQGYLSTVSIRNASPLWFATAGFCLLICVADRFRRLFANLASFVALGAVAVLGLGWRHDAALLPPVLGIGLTFFLLQRGRRFAYAAVALTFYTGGAGLCLSGINALCGFQRMTASTGFHVAFYGENTRCNLFDLENSFQIDWCDEHTYSEVRRLAFVATGDAANLPRFCDAAHLAKCREMYLAALRYNAFAWVSHFPQFYWQALRSLASPRTVQGVEVPDLQWVVPDWLSADHRPLFGRVWDVLPWLFMLGAIAALAAGAEPMAALCLLVFSVGYAAILLLVLPMSKHLALMLLPLHVFAGMGIWAALWLCRPDLWLRSGVPFLLSRRVRWALAGAASLALLWGLACAGSYAYSLRERDDYLHAVAELAGRGVPAPETLRGKQRFTVRIAPTSDAPMRGYLLTVRTGMHPAPLECRHLHHPAPGAGWGKTCTTRHALEPNRTQSFFVTCCQGACFGDLRPYACTVTVEGDAEIVASTRVDLSRWNRLALSTVFCEDLHHPGSPPVPGPSSRSEWIQMPVYGCVRAGDSAAGADQRAQPEAGSPRKPSARPLHHLVARNLKTGELRFALSEGHRFVVETLGGWCPTIAWGDLFLGDFDGDGLLDVAGRENQGGTLWVSRFAKAVLVNEAWGNWPPGDDWVDAGVGDFDGDGLDDLFVRNRRTGELWVARSDGRRFALQPWAQWAPQVAWRHLRIGDFNGDGKSDVAGYDPTTGDWWVALAGQGRFQTTRWGRWPMTIDWRHVCVGDFNGDGKSDFAGWDPVTGQWWVALSRGDGFECRPFGSTDPADPWEDVAVGDVDADGRDDLVGRSARTGQCWVARSDGKAFRSHPYGVLPGAAAGLCVADFDGDGRADVAWRDSVNGALWVGLSSDGAFHFERWGEWPATEQLTPLRVFSGWR